MSLSTVVAQKTLFISSVAVREPVAPGQAIVAGSAIALAILYRIYAQDRTDLNVASPLHQDSEATRLLVILL